MDLYPANTRREFLLHAAQTLLASTAIAAPIRLFFPLQPVAKLSGPEIDSMEPFLHPLANTFYLDPQGRPAIRQHGLSSNIFLDKKNMRVTKQFISPLDGEKKYRIEKETYLRLMALGSEYIPKNIAFDDSQISISMDFYGPDLSLLGNDELNSLQVPAHEQFYEMFEEYRAIGIYKLNFFASNLSLNRATGRVIAFNFSCASPRRPELIKREMDSLSTFYRLQKNSRINRLQEILSDGALPLA